jgi:hypothetical protein
MVSHLGLQRGFQHPFRELAEQPVRADQLDSLLPGLGHQLLGDTLLVNRRRRRLLLLLSRR